MTCLLHACCVFLLWLLVGVHLAVFVACMVFLLVVAACCVLLAVFVACMLCLLIVAGVFLAVFVACMLLVGVLLAVFTYMLIFRNQRVTNFVGNSFAVEGFGDGIDPSPEEDFVRVGRGARRVPSGVYNWSTGGGVVGRVYGNGRQMNR